MSDDQTLLRDADTAMYRAKAIGGGRCVRFVPEMHAEIAEHVAIEQRLRRPSPSAASSCTTSRSSTSADSTVRGYEALLRMRPDGGNPLRPDEFIPVAEKTGLILPIGAFVIDEACRQIAAWRRAHWLDMDQVFVAVNVSSRQLHEHGFVADVLGALERHSVPTRCLHIEITESLLMDDIEMAIEMLDVLRDRGIHISVDDFGTGHSSLGYLKRLPVGTVKVDRSFVSGLGDVTDRSGARRRGDRTGRHGHGAGPEPVRRGRGRRDRAAARRAAIARLQLRPGLVLRSADAAGRRRRLVGSQPSAQRHRQLKPPAQESAGRYLHRVVGLHVEGDQVGRPGAARHQPAEPGERERLVVVAADVERHHAALVLEVAGDPCHQHHDQAASLSLGPYDEEAEVVQPAGRVVLRVALLEERRC